MFTAHHHDLDRSSYLYIDDRTYLSLSIYDKFHNKDLLHITSQWFIRDYGRILLVFHGSHRESALLCHVTKQNNCDVIVLTGDKQTHTALVVWNDSYKTSNKCFQIDRKFTFLVSNKRERKYLCYNFIK